MAWRNPARSFQARSDKKQIEVVAGLLVVFGFLAYLGIIELYTGQTTITLTASSLLIGIVGVIIGFVLVIVGFKK
jgi:uncharacterized membrane protein